MMKRCGSFDEKNGKKPKLDEDDDWDDDIDEAALEKAFDIYESSQKENTMLVPPTYNSFKHPRKYAASTQMSTSISATAISLNSNQMPVPGLEAQINKLELQNKEKDGEISILRNKIKESKIALQIEQNKSTAEWRQKLVASERQANTTKSELEFKNLEIINLKQQLAEVKRQFKLELNNSQMLSENQFIQPAPPPPLNNLEDSSLHRTSLGKSATEKEIETRKACVAVKTEIISSPVYPLKSRLPPNLFQNFSKEKHVWKVDTPKVSRSTTPYLQNQGYKTDTLFQHKCIDLSQERIKTDDFYHDFVMLMNSSIEELESLERTQAIKRILTLSIVEMSDLNDFLIKFGSSLKTEAIKQMDANYLLEDFEKRTDFSSWEFEKDQYGIKSGKLLTLLTSLLPYNRYLQNCILLNTCFEGDFVHTNCDRWQIEFKKYDNYFLEQTLHIVTSVGKYRQASVTTEFLSSVIKFLICITKLKDSENVVEKYFKMFFRELVCARPEPKVIYELTFFIKNTVRYRTMIEFFFKNDDKIPKEVIRKSIINYKIEGSCAFCIFHLLYQITLLKAKNLPIVVCVNVLSFIHNTFKYFSWIHHDRSNVCICQSQLYTVAVETIFNIMERYIDRYNTHKRYDLTLEEWDRFLSHPFVVKVLNLMSFNAFGVLEKFLVVYAKFKEIQRVLKDKWQFYDAEVSTNADMPTITESKFAEIDF